MAESQVPYPYHPQQIAAIRASISEPRFATYLDKGGDHERYAIALYLYNGRVAKAFLFPLNVVEVTLRNGIDEILVQQFGPKWHLESDFRDSTLKPEGLDSLNKAINRAGQRAPRGQVIAALTFDFWSNLFRSDYGDLWRTKVNILFPNLAHRETRQHIQDLVKPINAFRNRVAHHEPVLDMNINDIHAKIVRLTGLRCEETAAWLKHHSTLHLVTRTRPKPDGASPVILADYLDPHFVAVRIDATMADIGPAISDKRPAVVCHDEAGAPIGAFTMMDVVRFISNKSQEGGGLIDLTSHTVSQMLTDPDMAGRSSFMSDTSSIADAIKELQMPRIHVLVGTGSTGMATGVLLRAHRRY